MDARHCDILGDGRFDVWQVRVQYDYVHLGEIIANNIWSSWHRYLAAPNNGNDAQMLAQRYALEYFGGRVRHMEFAPLGVRVDWLARPSGWYTIGSDVCLPDWAGPLVDEITACQDHLTGYGLQYARLKGV